MKRDLIEFTQYITPDGVVYDLDTSKRFVFTETGFGMPPIEFITQKAPGQHGETVLDYRLQPRILQLLYREQGCSRDEYWQDRNTLLDMLRPNRQQMGYFQPGVLRKVLPNGSKRDINVFIQQGPVFEARSLNVWDEFAYTETLRFIAHDPIFYDPDAICYVWNIDELQNHLVFEANGVNTEDLIFHKDGVGAGLIFQSSGIEATQTITYTGTWHTYPIFVIRGPAGGLVIQNTTTSEEIRFTRDILSGETVTVYLTPTTKAIESSVYGNIIGSITSNSDISMFHIATSPEATGGVNVLKIGGAMGVVGITSVSMSFNTRYIGI